MTKDEIKQLLNKYKSPVKRKEFKKYWTNFLQIIVDRDNFNESHLKNFEVLCNLYVEYDRMTFFLNDYHDREGTYSYIAEGRHGTQIKTHPEFTERQKLLSEIRQYSRLLGIVLDKDTTMKPDDNEGEWK